VLTGQLSYRITYSQSLNIRFRFGIYHFVRRVPADVKQYYRSDRASISRRTKSAKTATRSAQSVLLMWSQVTDYLRTTNQRGYLRDPSPKLHIAN
jgi:hypothetical protein